MTSTRRSVILTSTANGLTPVLVLVSIYVTFRGHNAPGGGFAGGLILGAAVVLRYLADGPRALDRLRIDPVSIIGAGLLVSVAVALAPLPFGDQLLESTIWKVQIPAIGTVKVVSSAGFDLGVFLLVFGTVVTLVQTFVRADDAADAIDGASGATGGGTTDSPGAAP